MGLLGAFFVTGCKHDRGTSRILKELEKKIKRFTTGQVIRSPDYLKRENTFSVFN
jgi:hypothetical protein